MFIVDASNLVLGRLASLMAYKLRGKDKPSFTPHAVCGDKIVVYNADKIHLTGKKLTQERFYWHTGYAGGIKSKTFKERKPEHIIEKAVERMLPKGPLSRKLMKNLRVYTGTEHPFKDGNVWDVASLNPKNKAR